MQVHGIGGAVGVLWYALMAKKELVTELYGEASCHLLQEFRALLSASMLACRPQNGCTPSTWLS